MAEISTKPYLIRAIYEWCADAGFTPYLNVKVDQQVRVPLEYVKNGEIVLSMSQQATRNLTIGNDLIQFSARFNGASREISIPLYAVQSIFARENGRGMSFEPEPRGAESAAAAKPPTTGPTLQAVHSISTASNIRPAQADDEAPLDPPPSPDKPREPQRGKLRIIK